MTVEVEVTPEPEPVEETPGIVVVDTGDSTSGGDDVELGVRLGTLMEKVETLEAEIREVRLQQELAEISTPEVTVAEVAEVVEDVIEEALAEEEAPEPVEPDSTPDKVHWAHRGRGELFGKGEN